MGEIRYTFHIGLHCTDEDRLLTCLLQNEDVLESAGSVAARPGRFRPALRKPMLALKGQPASEQVQQDILDAVIDADHPQHVLFSSDSFLCVPYRAIVGDKLYPLVRQRAPWIRNLFPDAPARFCLAIRNPATLIPALHARFPDEETFETYVGRIEPEALSWRDMILRLKESVPDAEVVVWCNEDSALLWPELLRLLGGLPDGVALDGEADFLQSLMTPDGFKRLQSYLSTRADLAPIHKRRVLGAFLDKFATPESTEQTSEAQPFWDAARLEDLTRRYEADIARIQEMEGVRFLLP